MDKVQTVKLVATNGRSIRMVTKVTLADGRVVTFMERMPKQRAIEQAKAARR